jgi:hypothetical protein
MGAVLFNNVFERPLLRANSSAQRGASSAQSPIERFDRMALSERDRRILALARRNLGSTSIDFGEAVRVLREAVEQLIPAGRIYLLGTATSGPILGSIVSGVGIVADADGILLVRVDRDGQRTTLGSFSS